MNNHKYDFLFIMLTIGESGVGKTDFICKYTDDSYQEAKRNLLNLGKFIFYYYANNL